MPNRILKESICTSESLAALSPGAEIFFYRLLVQCDDYGCFDARLPILRARCFPLHLDRITERDIDGWLTELRSAGVVTCYQAEGKPYLKFVTWEAHQQIRAKRRKYPQPPSFDSIGNQMISDACYSPRNPIQSEPESEAESEGESKSGNQLQSSAFLKSKPPKPKPEPDPTLKDPAVIAFRNRTHITPDPEWRRRIAAIVTDYARWDNTIIDWLGSGWNKRNVKGMLEVYESGPRLRNNGREPKPDPKLEALRMLEEEDPSG